MNRFDQIQGAARDVADWVCADPADRNRMADDLIRLVTLIVAGVGTSVAVDGESNISHGEDEAAHARYITGERIMDGAREMAEGAAGADLERYERDGLKPAWTSRRTAGAPAVDGPVNGAQADAQAPSGATYGCKFDGDSWSPEHLWVTVEGGDPDVLTGWRCFRCRTPRCEGCGEDANVGSHGAGWEYGGCV